MKETFVAVRVSLSERVGQLVHGLGFTKEREAPIDPLIQELSNRRPMLHLQMYTVLEDLRNSAIVKGLYLCSGPLSKQDLLARANKSLKGMVDFILIPRR